MDKILLKLNDLKNTLVILDNIEDNIDEINYINLKDNEEEKLWETLYNTIDKLQMKAKNKMAEIENKIVNNEEELLF